MTIANMIDIQKSKLKTCKEFADMFSVILLKESDKFSEVCVIFDSYNEVTLKSKTRENRTSGVQVC